MQPRFRYEDEHDFYERISRPLEIEEDEDVFVVDEVETERPWTIQRNRNVKPDKNPAPPPEESG